MEIYKKKISQRKIPNERFKWKTKTKTNCYASKKIDKLNIRFCTV